MLRSLLLLLLLLLLAARGCDGDREVDVAVSAAAEP